MRVQTQDSSFAKLFSFEDGHQMALFVDTSEAMPIIRLHSVFEGVLVDSRMDLKDPGTATPAVVADYLGAVLSKIGADVAENLLGTLRESLGKGAFAELRQAMIGDAGKEPVQWARMVETEDQGPVLVFCIDDEANQKAPSLRVVASTYVKTFAFQSEKEQRLALHDLGLLAKAYPHSSRLQALGQAADMPEVGAPEAAEAPRRRPSMG